jgi:hypothetical protein
VKFYVFGYYLLYLVSCGKGYPELSTIASGKSIRERVNAPSGYVWIDENEGSFGAYLQNALLLPDGSKIVDFKGDPIANQSEHVAILNYDVGKKDLQQCADAVIRLRAEYLFSEERYDEIGFHFTSGHLFKWNDYKKGIRPIVSKNNLVTFKKLAPSDYSYASFRKYLNVIYTYAGTISLNKETKNVIKDTSIKTGDILISAGSPGHVVVIVGRAKAKSSGEIVFLIAEGYTPAQSIHILTNPYHGKMNPWYKLSVEDRITVTARYTFSNTNIRSFY